MSIHYQIGLPESCRVRAAELYTEIISQNLSVINEPREKVLGFYVESIIPELAAVALNEGRLVGFIGFYHNGRHFTGGGGISGAIKWIGIFKGFFLATGYKILFEKKPESGVLDLDGFMVDSKMRGKGIGTRLFEELRQYGLKNGYTKMRLRVAEDNVRAIELYKRLGFKQTGGDTREYIKGIMGFSATVTMIRELS